MQAAARGAAAPVTSSAAAAFGPAEGPSQAAAGPRRPPSPSRRPPSPRKTQRRPRSPPRGRPVGRLNDGEEGPGSWDWACDLLPQFKFCDGPALHERVPPSHWCVALNDLRQFRVLTTRAICHGQVLSTPADPFDVADNTNGPSITSVTRQLIAPITKMMGSPSWALMLHPKGLQCDVFVTHCWREGVFEFIDKVLYSFPSDARHAYCCMLSNPQNLDIGGLVKHPDQSPFAQALETAMYTLVVPNSSCSIYTRTWCVYEAYLSYSWGKEIRTATRADNDAWLSVCLVVATSAVCFAATKFGFMSQGHCQKLNAFLHMFMLGSVGLLLTGTMNMRPSAKTCVVHHLGAGLCGAFTAVSFRAKSCRDDHYFFGCMDHLRLGEIPLFMHFTTGSFLFLALFFALREADRIWDRRASRDAALLRRDWTGRLQDAQASVEEDRARILDEIEAKGQRSKVENTIGVLIAAGMSTHDLRTAHALGVDISRAGRYSIALVYLDFLFMVGKTVGHIIMNTGCEGPLYWASHLRISEGLTLFLVFLLRGPEHRGLVASAGVVFGVVPYLLSWFLVIVLMTAGAVKGCHVHCFPDWLTALITGPIGIVISFLGIDGCARLPYVGRAVVWLLLRTHVSDNEIQSCVSEDGDDPNVIAEGSDEDSDSALE